MVTAQDIRIEVKLDKQDTSYGVGERVSGIINIHVPGKIVLWRIALSIAGKKQSIAQNAVLKRGKNSFAFNAQTPISTINYQGNHLAVQNFISVAVWPSRMENELKGEAYMKAFGMGFLGNTIKEFTIPTTLAGFHYHIPASPIVFLEDIPYWRAGVAALLLLLPINFLVKLIIFPIFLFLLWRLERAFVKRHRFGHLRGEIKTDAKGQPHLHLKTNGSDQDFLDAEIGWQLLEVQGNRDHEVSRPGIATRAKIKDVAIALSHQEYVVPIPLPEKPVPHTVRYGNTSFKWQLEIRQPKAEFGKILFRQLIKIGLKAKGPQWQELTAENDRLELEDLAESRYAVKSEISTRTSKHS